ncbi:hypothetical protein [Rheinheimera sp. 4Y26]|uniref:hypothetical protein n=1 Tax=Rheinheimera sp. 4Y26 TaxID=2977811 RepID=UPI0021B15444|nr:hypothetical protein [Rheinheimera sp. 4Y26]MCT6698320.1 hypothetical protein [Rheinheimera sp. 4Y26]
MSVINQMLKDLDQQQGKKGPAVVSQRPSLPRPPGRSNQLLWAFGVLLVIGGGFSLLAPERLSHMLALLSPQPEVAAPLHTSPNTGPITRQDAKSDSSQSQASVAIAEQEPVATAQSQNAAPQQNQSISNQSEPAATNAAEAGAEAPAAPQAGTAAAQTATPQAESGPAEVRSTETAAAEPVTAAAALPEPKALAVWPSEPEGSSQLYPAAKAETFAAEQSPTQAVAPSSMQVEQVVFDKTMQLAQLKQQATAALASASYAELGTKAQQYIELSPNEVLGYEWLAESYRQLQQWQALGQLLQLCAGTGLSSDGLQLQQARLFSQQKNWGGAESALAQLSSKAITPEVLQLKANALQQQQKLPEALLAWQQLTSIQPGFSRGWLGQALVLEQLGQLAQAKQAYQQALTAGGLSAATVQFIQQRLATAE